MGFLVLAHPMCNTLQCVMFLLFLPWKPGMREGSAVNTRFFSLRPPAYHTDTCTHPHTLSLSLSPSLPPFLPPSLPPPLPLSLPLSLSPPLSLSLSPSLPPLSLSLSLSLSCAAAISFLEGSSRLMWAGHMPGNHLQSTCSTQTKPMNSMSHIVAPITDYL